MTQQKAQTQFRAQAKDTGGEWVVMCTGTPEEARSRVVREAGAMVAAGWVVRGMNRQEITVGDPDHPKRRTQFRVAKVTEPQEEKPAEPPQETQWQWADPMSWRYTGGLAMRMQPVRDDDYDRNPMQDGRGM